MATNASTTETTIETTTLQPDARMIEHALRLLHEWEDGVVTELRIPHHMGGTVSGLYDDPAEFAKDAVELNGAYNSPAIYGTFNHINLVAVATKYKGRNGWFKKVGKGTATADEDIDFLIWLYIDIDSERPAGVAATVAEKYAAFELGRRIKAYLCQELGFPLPLVFDSGNGFGLYFRINLPNTPENRRLVQQCLQALHEQFSNDAAKVDTTVHNPARIARIPGTINRKGPNTPDRPHRMAKIVQIPDAIEAVNEMKLLQLASMARVAQPTAPPQPQQTAGTAPAKAATADVGTRRLDVGAWIREHGLAVASEEPYSGYLGAGRIWVLAVCPWNQGHTDRSAYIIQFDNGAISAGCHHDHCADYNWQSLRELLEPGFANKRRRQAAAEFAAKMPPNGEPQRFIDVQPGTIVMALDRGNYGTVLADHGDSCAVRFVSEAGETATKEMRKSELATVDGTPLCLDDFKLSFIDSREFNAKQYTETALVKRMLIAKQPALVGGRSKTLKTSLLVNLAVSLGTGGLFLGQFETTQCRVAVLSGESGERTLQETARRVAAARGVNLDDADVLWEFRLPQLANNRHMEILAEAIIDAKAAVAILDPAYLCLLSGDVKGRNAANVFDMGGLLLGLTQVGNETGATIILAHHCRKNLAEPYQPPELEDLAMAGFSEWARQWLLLGRREAFVQGSGEHSLWLNFGGSAGYSGLWAVNVREGQLAEDFSGRFWDVELTPPNEAREAASRTKRTATEAAREAKIREMEQVILTWLRRHKDPASSRLIADGCALSHSKVSIPLVNLVRKGLVRQFEGKSGRQTCTLNVAVLEDDLYKRDKRDS